MKVILLRDIPKIGKKHEVKEVSEGYAQNFLFPKKYAEAATPSKVAKLEEQKIASSATQQLHHELFVKTITSLEGAVVMLAAKGNDKGHLYEGIHKDEIIAAIMEQKGVRLSPEHVALVHPLKTTGDHLVVVGTKEVSATVTISIQEQK